MLPTDAKLEKPHPIAITPRFRLIGRHLICNNYALDLNRRPMIRRLIKTFLETGKPSLSKKQILTSVYDSLPARERSERMRFIIEQNLTKLISRARILLEQSFNTMGQQWINFFIYDEHARTYLFYQLGNEYLHAKELELQRRFAQIRQIRQSLLTDPKQIQSTTIEVGLVGKSRHLLA